MIDGHQDDIRLAAHEARLPVIEAVEAFTEVKLTDEQAEQVAQACIKEGHMRGHLMTHAAYVYYRAKDEARVEKETRERYEIERRRRQEVSE